MVLSISTNTASLNVQRNLNEANEASASSLAKLSSGSRVPTSKDDAASLAIGSRVEAEIAGLKQASTNASQATSLLQIADGAYGEINDILVRQSTLAIQSSSGQLSDTERAIIDSEFQNLNAEVDRIAEDTEFNGNQLLNGGATVSTTDEVSTGALAAQGLSVSFDSNTVNGGDTFDVTYDKDSEVLTLTNKTTGEVTEKDITADMDAQAGAGANLAAGQDLAVEFKDAGITITLSDDFERGTAITSADPLTGVANGASTLNMGSSASSVNTDAILAAQAGETAIAAGVMTIELSATSSIEASGTLQFAVDGGAVGTTTGNLTAGQSVEIFAADGATSLGKLTIGDDFVAGNDAGDTITIDTTAATMQFDADETTSSTADFSFKIGTGTGASDDISVSVDSVTTAALGTNASAVGTQADANSAINAVKGAIDTLQGSRAEVGASLSRLDFASSNLSVSIENQSAAKSGLLDVDVASETTEFASQQVILQAGVSLLAQANQRPSQLLSLIG